MTVSINHRAPHTLEMKVTGKVGKADYEQFTPLAERLIEKHGSINLLVELPDKLRFTPSALWADIKFDVRHFSDVERIALVSARESRKWLATIAKPFTRADVRFFESNDIDDARIWVDGSQGA